MKLGTVLTRLLLSALIALSPVAGAHAGSSLNLAIYVGADPINATDPDGQQTVYGDVLLRHNDLGPAGIQQERAAQQQAVQQLIDHPGETLQAVGLVVQAGSAILGQPEGVVIGRGISTAGQTIEAAGSTSTLKPGPFAGESVLATGPGKATASQQRDMNRIGGETGCHTCGTKDAPRYVGDHQPPTALAKPGETQRLYPQCPTCSSRQGGYVRAEAQRRRADKKDP